MSCGIYKITNTINNKCYIGQSVQIERRWVYHRGNYNNQNESTYDTHFYRAIRKYGIENFKFEVIEECKENELDEREIYWIAYYDSFNNGYNSTIGGAGTLHVNREEFKKYFLENNPSVQDIAKHFNIDRSVAGRIMKDLGLKALYYVSKEKEQQICEYYLSDLNLSLLDISNKFNIDRNTASKVLKRNNIEVRKMTTNSLNKYKKILVYDLDGNFIREDLLFNFKQWLFENGYTKDGSGRCVMGCLAGKLWQSNGFIVRWYKENYPKKIKKTDYWDKNGAYQYNLPITKKHEPTTIKKYNPTRGRLPSDTPILVYESKTGLLIRQSSFLQEVNVLVEHGNDEKKAKRKIWNILGAHKKSYNNYIYRYYRKDYPQKINISKGWKTYWWGRDVK